MAHFKITVPYRSLNYYEIRSVLLLVLCTLPLLFMPKINFTAMEGETAGVRIDDLILMIFTLVLLFAHFSLRKGITDIEKWIIISTELSVEAIKKSILYAIENHAALSEKSLKYSEKYHSYKACAVMWDKIFESLEKQERPINYFHPIIGEYSKDYENYVHRRKSTITTFESGSVYHRSKVRNIPRET